eukprot:1160184-Pelagomonas_calceolata.AAC.2
MAGFQNLINHLPESPNYHPMWCIGSSGTQICLRFLASMPQVPICWEHVKNMHLLGALSTSRALLGCEYGCSRAHVYLAHTNLTLVTGGQGTQPALKIWQLLFEIERGKRCPPPATLAPCESSVLELFQSQGPRQDHPTTEEPAAEADRCLTCFLPSGDSFSASAQTPPSNILPSLKRVSRAAQGAASTHPFLIFVAAPATLHRKNGM